MHYQAMREELRSYYREGTIEQSEQFRDRCWAKLDALVTDDMPVMEQKLLQYRVIVDEMEPVVFQNSPFYYETGVLTALSDGAHIAKETGRYQAAGWVYHRNASLFITQNPALWEKRQAQGAELLYLICGPYNDTIQHFAFNNRPVLQSGLKGVYEHALQSLEKAETQAQRTFLRGVCRAMLEIKRAAEKFAKNAEDLLADASDPEARDYLVTGCWGIHTYQEKADCGNYVNLLKPFEYALHRLYDKMEKVQLTFETFDDCRDFEELYQRVLVNCKRLMEERASITRQGGQVFQQVDPLPIFSAMVEDCIDRGADYRDGGARYRDENFLLFGFPDIMDSLLAIKTLVFDTRQFTLTQMLDAVRRNWTDCEDMRQAAIGCPGWGDGSEASCALAARFQNDLFAIADSMVGGYGGKVHLKHLTYTEIRWWGEKTLATPNGRRNGEYFAQGLTPSRLKHIPCVNDVIHSLAALDGSTMINNVVNFILPPENYPDLIVRVTGFSVRFTSLSPEWQQEVLTRNFYEE